MGSFLYPVQTTCFGLALSALTRDPWFVSGGRLSALTLVGGFFLDFVVSVPSFEAQLKSHFFHESQVFSHSTQIFKHICMIFSSYSVLLMVFFVLFILSLLWNCSLSSNASIF